MILLANAIWRRSFPLSAPGHWLLASQATGVLPLIAYSFLFFAMEGPPTGYAAVSTFAAIIQFALHVSACIRFRSEKLWAVLFGVITLLDCSVVIQLVVTMVAFSGNIQPAANSIAGNLLQAISWFYLLRPSISFFVFVTVVAFDFSKWSSRDWLHWLGILLYGAHLMGGLATFVMIAVARFS